MQISMTVKTATGISNFKDDQNFSNWFDMLFPLSNNAIAVNQSRLLSLVLQNQRQLGELDAKLKALHLRLKKSDAVIGKKDKQTISRQRTSLARAIDHPRSSIQETKFTQGETKENIEEWSEEIEKQPTLQTRAAGSCTGALRR